MTNSLLLKLWGWDDINSYCPLILVGYIFYSTGIINSFRNLKVIAWTTLIFGILMYFADTFKIKKNIKKDLTIKIFWLLEYYKFLQLYLAWVELE